MSDIVLADSELGLGQSSQRSWASNAARAAAKASLRRYSMATAGSRCTPEVVVIGAKRGGTTTVWRHLSEHPGFLPLFPARQKIKGTYYLADRFDESPSWYRGHFPTLRTKRKIEAELGHGAFTVDASPYYLTHPLAPQRSTVACSSAVFVAVLRDPVERAFSHWKERTANGTESLGFYDALLAEEARVGDAAERLERGAVISDFAHRHQTYLGQSRYAASIARWRSHVGDRLEVWVSEEVHAEPEAHMNRLWNRLGLPPVEEVDGKAYNAHPGSTLDPRAREFLETRLLDDVRALEAELGRSLPWVDQWTLNPAGASMARPDQGFEERTIID